MPSPPPVRATGRQAKLRARLLPSSNYGQTPASGSGWFDLPFISTSLSASGDLQEDDVLGRGRDGADPEAGPVNVAGEVVIPADDRALGWWLTLVLGAPATTGVGPYTHVWQSGAEDLPNAVIEIHHPQAQKTYVYAGVCGGGLRFDQSRGGRGTFTIDLMAQSEVIGAAPIDADATSYVFNRFLQRQGALLVGGAAVADVTAGSLTFSNNLEAVEAIRPDGLIGGLDAGAAVASGSITSRFGVNALPVLANGVTPVAIAMSFERSANSKITFGLPRVFLPKSTPPISGPNGIDVTYNWQAGRTGETAKMTVTLVNDVQAYEVPE